MATPPLSYVKCERHVDEVERSRRRTTRARARTTLLDKDDEDDQAGRQEEKRREGHITVDLNSKPAKRTTSGRHVERVH